MEQIKKLYDKTKESLLFTNKCNPDKGIELIKEVQAKLKYLKEQYPDLMQQLSSLEVISLNNLACAYNKKGKCKASLYHLHTAHEIQREIFPNVEASNDPEALHQVATTHSNMCAVLSQMGDHEKAYRQISKSIQLLLKTPQTAKSDALLVFYFNCAVELQYLNNLNDAHKMAQKGYYLSAKSNKEMQRKFVELIEKLEDKIKRRQKRVAKMMLESIKMRNKSTTDDKSVGRRGNSLNLISQHNSIQENVETHGFTATLTKQFSAYYSKMPKIPNKTMRVSEYPMVRLPSFVESNKKLGMALGLEQRKKVLSLYSPEKRQQRIPKNHRLSLKRREETLSKIMLEQSVV